VTVEFFLITNQDEFKVRVFFQARMCRSHYNFGAEVAAHGIE
jgi:hypothetical protein